MALLHRGFITIEDAKGQRAQITFYVPKQGEGYYGVPPLHVQCMAHEIAASLLSRGIIKGHVVEYGVSTYESGQWTYPATFLDSDIEEKLEYSIFTSDGETITLSIPTFNDERLQPGDTYLEEFEQQMLLAEIDTDNCASEAYIRLHSARGGQFQSIKARREVWRKRKKRR